MTGESGLSAARLGRLHDVMARHVERGLAPGLVTVVSRRGETHVDAIGTKAVGGADPMRRDTIFRIASLTKPITAVGALILIEECRLRLDEPIDRWLPELADRRVLRRLDGPLDDTVPADRPIMVRDLLTFTMGFGSVMSAEPTPIGSAIIELELGGMGPSAPARTPGTDEWLRRLGSLPLMCQPGARWLYHTPADVLGALIERVTGGRLEVFLHERIFEPLGMVDTAFSVPTDRLDRLATSYEPDDESGALTMYDGAADSQWNRPPAFEAGGGGLVSTADDYLAFARMLLQGGTLGGERIVSRLAVELMTTDHLTPAQKAVSGLAPGDFDHRGWGFGLEVVTSRDDLMAVPAKYGWVGGLGTSWDNDPREQMISILLTQRAFSAAPPEIWLDFRTASYAAIDD